MNLGQEPTMIDKIKNTASEYGQNISNGLDQVAQNVSSGLQQVGDNINKNVSDFSSNSTVPASTTFLDTNTIFAKFAFIILIVVAFIIVFNLGMRFITYFFSTSSNPYLINGQLSANNVTTITQDPAKPSSILIPRSNNAFTGIEFTWSVWISSGVGTTNTIPNYLNVFTKGDFSKSSNNGEIPSVNNAPGVYFGPCSNTTTKDNSIWILMDTVLDPAAVNVSSGTGGTEYIEITNIPINKYFHLAIRCENKFIDVYINGTIVSHTNLINVPKQNYYDVTIGDSRFNNSYISNLRYFSTALSVVDINTIVKDGPNTANVGQSTMPNYMPNYLSSLWYSGKIQ